MGNSVRAMPIVEVKKSPCAKLCEGGEKPSTEQSKTDRNDSKLTRPKAGRTGPIREKDLKGSEKPGSSVSRGNNGNPEQLMPNAEEARPVHPCPCSGVKLPKHRKSSTSTMESEHAGLCRSIGKSAWHIFRIGINKSRHAGLRTKSIEPIKHLSRISKLEPERAIPSKSTTDSQQAEL